MQQTRGASTYSLFATQTTSLKAWLSSAQNDTRALQKSLWQLWNQVSKGISKGK